MTPTARTVRSSNQKLKAVITPAADGQSGATATIGEENRPGKTFTLSTRWMPVDVVLFQQAPGGEALVELLMTRRANSW